MQPHPSETQEGGTEEGNNPHVSAKEQQIITKLFGFGIAEVVLGIGSAILSIVVLCEIWNNESYRTSYYYESNTTRIVNQMAAGIWCGAVLVTTGICGILAKKGRKIGRKPLYDINVTMSLMSSVLQAVQALVSMFAAASTLNCVAVQILHSMIAFVGFVGMIIAVLHMACCHPVSCCHKQPRPKRQAVYYTAPPMMQQCPQYVQLANGQVVMLQMQPLLQGYHGGMPVTPMPNAPYQMVYMQAPQTAPPPMAGMVPPATGPIPQVTTPVPPSAAANVPRQNVQQAAFVPVTPVTTPAPAPPPATGPIPQVTTPVQPSAAANVPRQNVQQAAFTPVTPVTTPAPPPPQAENQNLFNETVSGPKTVVAESDGQAKDPWTEVLHPPAYSQV